MTEKHVLTRLQETIALRRSSSSEASYTKSLLEKGIAVCAKKLGEEATETVIAALVENETKLVSEAADLIYHLLVLLEARNLPVGLVFEELERREKQSGLAEKASRQP